jgi:hypothetical protein
LDRRVFVSGAAMTPKNIRERIKQKMEEHRIDFVKHSIGATRLLESMEALFLELLAEAKNGDQS